MIQNHILIVDDDAINQWLLTDSLNTLGFMVTGLCRGGDAIDLLDHEQDFDLLLTDLHLPDGMSGFHLAEQWRLRQPGRPVLYTSTDPLTATSGLDRDEGFIRKHAESSELTVVIERLLYEARTCALPRFERRTHHIH